MVETQVSINSDRSALSHISPLFTLSHFVCFRAIHGAIRQHRTKKLFGAGSSLTDSNFMKQIFLKKMMWKPLLNSSVLANSSSFTPNTLSVKEDWLPELNSINFFVILCVCTMGLPSCLFFIGLGWNVYWASKKLLQIILRVFWKLGTNFNPIEWKISVAEA